MILSMEREDTLCRYKLANFRKQSSRGINNNVYLEKITVFVELNTRELVMCCAFNFLSQIMKSGSVLLWKDFFIITQISFALIKLNQLFHCRVPYGPLLFLLTKKCLEYTRFMNFIKMLDGFKRNIYTYISGLMTCKAWFRKCSLGRR